MASRYEQLVEALRYCANNAFCNDCPIFETCVWMKHGGMTMAADAIEALVKRVNLSELKIKEYKGEADLYRDLYRSAHEAFLKELYGKHETLANLQSLKQSPIPYNLCPNRAQDVYNLCANYPEKPDSSENPNS